MEPKVLREVFVTKARIKFTKLGNIKYIGHLDILRLFQRCIRRAELPIKYSQGYNPHQILSIALPLPLGATSEGEYIDMELSEECVIEESMIKERLNTFLPEGMLVEDVCFLDNKMAVGMAAVDACDYQIFVKKSLMNAHFKEVSNDYFAQKEIWAKKITKKKTTELNIKEMIYNYSINENDNQWIINLFLATGSRSNLKPETVIRQLFENNKLEFKDYMIQIHRKDIFGKLEKKFIPLSQLNKWSE